MMEAFSRHVPPLSSDGREAAGLCAGDEKARRETMLLPGGVLWFLGRGTYSGFTLGRK